MNELEQALRHPDVIRNKIKQNGRRAVTEAYSPDNPPPYPVTKVNGQTGDVDIPTVNLPVSVQNGGTGETTAAQAAKNLGVLPLGEVVTKIPSNADLDNYGLPGVYAVNNNDIARTIANMPEGCAGTLRVFSGLGSDITASSTWKYLIQEYVAYYGRTYHRYGESGSGTTLTWGAWRTVYDSRDFPLSVTMGGTGASSAAAARTNLGVPTLLDVYPVGSIYMSVNSTSPATLFGGTWERIQDRFLLAAGSTYAAGNTGGEATHTLTVEEIPSHIHEYAYNGQLSNMGTEAVRLVAHDRVNGYSGTPNGYTGGGQAHNNMPPYLAVYMWKRTK